MANTRTITHPENLTQDVEYEVIYARQDGKLASFELPFVSLSRKAGKLYMVFAGPKAAKWIAWNSIRSINKV
jgi:hypothetical protein